MFSSLSLPIATAKPSSLAAVAQKAARLEGANAPGARPRFQYVRRALITRAAAKLGRARENFERACREAYPVGSAIYWLQSGRRCAHGHVLAHGPDGQFQVRNRATGKIYWIGSEQVL